MKHTSLMHAWFAESVTCKHFILATGLQNFMAVHQKVARYLSQEQIVGTKEKNADLKMTLMCYTKHLLISPYCHIS